MPLISVTAKDDLGFSPKFGPICKDQTYEIEESDFTDQLFNLPESPNKKATKGGSPCPE